MAAKNAKRAKKVPKEPKDKYRANLMLRGHWPIATYWWSYGLFLVEHSFLDRRLEIRFAIHCQKQAKKSLSHLLLFLSTMLTGEG